MATDWRTKVRNTPLCPVCGAAELHPTEDAALVRVAKVHHSGSWWSHCLVCAGYYTQYTNPDMLVVTPHRFNEHRGWYREA